MGIIKDAMNKIGIGDTDVKEEEVKGKEQSERITGKIIKVSPEGWGFISSKTIPFTRIFFHWTSLRQDTLNFKELTKGMQVTFIAQYSDDKGCRAIQIKIEEEEQSEE